MSTDSPTLAESESTAAALAERSRLNEALQRAAREVLGRDATLADALGFAADLFPASQLGLHSQQYPSCLVLAKQNVVPDLTGLRDEDWFETFGCYVVWRNISAFADALGGIIGRAAYAELNGDSVPDDAGYMLDTTAGRISSQLRYNSGSFNEDDYFMDVLHSGIAEISDDVFGAESDEDEDEDEDEDWEEEGELDDDDGEDEEFEDADDDVDAN